MNRLCAAVLAVSSLIAWADDVTPEQAAKVERDNKAAQEEISKKYGNKKSSELSADERREMIADQKAASAKVLEKNGVSAKDYARFEATASGSQREAAKASGAALDKKEAEKKEAEKKAAAEKVAKPAGAGSGGVVVEKGLPPEEQQEGRGEAPRDVKPRGKGSRR